MYSDRVHRPEGHAGLKTRGNQPDGTFYQVAVTYLNEKLAVWLDHAGPSLSGSLRHMMYAYFIVSSRSSRP